LTLNFLAISYSDPSNLIPRVLVCHTRQCQSEIHANVRHQCSLRTHMLIDEHSSNGLQLWCTMPCACDATCMCTTARARSCTYMWLCARGCARAPCLLALFLPFLPLPFARFRKIFFLAEKGCSYFSAVLVFPITLARGTVKTTFT